MEDYGATVTAPLLTESRADTTTVDSAARATDRHYTSYAIYTVSMHLLRYVPPFILMFGFFGNTMTIIIMRRMKSGDSTINLYFMVLAAFDQIYLLMGPLVDWISLVFSFRLAATHSVFCQAHTWLYTGGSTIGAWCLVCMTVHRALSVVWPHRVNVLFTPRRVRVLILGIIVFFAAMYSHYFYGNQVLCSSRSGNCWCVVRFDDNMYTYFIVKIFVYIEITVYSLLPFIIMTVSNGVLIWKLNQSVKAAGKVLSQGDAEQVQAREKAARSASVTVIVVSVAFLVLTLPGSLNYILNYFESYTGHSASNYETALRYFIGVMCNIFSDMNTSINFYLYCLTGRRFREEFIKILCCGRNRRRRGAHQ